MQMIEEYTAMVDWGDVPTWLGGIGTTLAVIVALWQSGGETRKRRRDERMSQARQVAAWIEPGDLVPNTDDKPELGDREVAVHIKNGSDVPIYTVIVVLVPLKGTKAERGEDVVYVGPEMASHMVFSVVPPGIYETTFALPPWANKEDQRTGAEIAFMDSAGRSWARRGNGELKSLGTADPRKNRVFDGSGLHGDLYRVEDS